MSDTPETDNLARGNHVVPTEWAEQLERERDEAQASLTDIHRWIERNHPDGFIDSQTWTQNLERVTDRWYERLDRVERERDEARAKCPDGVWVSEDCYMRLHAAASRLLTKINATIPPGFFQQIEREYDSAMTALYP